MSKRALLPLVQAALNDRYTVDAEIGRGGAAVVFRATSPEGEVVALKILRPELCVTVTAERFLREIEIVKQLHHPKIGRLLDAGERDWLVYYVMPFIEGRSLQSVLSRHGKLSVSDSLRIGTDLLDALGHAHQAGIVHRDVKPDNIIIGRDGAYLLDFGISRAVALSGTDRLTRSGVAVGTSHYMSPEQIMAVSEPDPRSDLYSVGCVLYECLTGQPPYVHTNEIRVLQLHQTAPVPDVRAAVPGIPDSFAQAITKSLAKHPHERWATAAEMTAAMRG
ncbi:MAG: serine/threonine-protein kinase [Gemmatimonadales bacterium]